MKALALNEFILHLPGALFGLLQAPHGVGVLAVTEIDVTQVEVCPVEILQQLALSLESQKKRERIADNPSGMHDNTPDVWFVLTRQ